MKTAIIILICSVLLSGCAYVKVRTPNNIEFTSFTVLKDVRIDPNGLASTTSSSADSIIGGLVGFFTAWFAK